ncbi:hypothetical protein BZM27_46930 [Paraburkholderia steynii]|uniref:Nucleotidyltransferase-like domain-containing protein n=1 Tax=Paraburkholderia steynii TaxID=1245441 RepID=A0A4R0XCH1_9BURK|nr:hypothetical protein BZM27_46930 [Paraburkholderia steynii]
MSDLQQFSKLAIALRPWRQQVVYIGGWAFRLYRYEPRAAAPGFDPIFTQDADVAYEVRAPLAKVGNIGTALHEAGFQEVVNLAGDFRPHARRYTLGDEAKGFYAEFLTPLPPGDSGKERVAPGKKEFRPKVTEESAGVVAQRLRHLEVLLHDPWVVTIPEEESGVGEAIVDLRVPNPVSFVVQKLLIRDIRSRNKRPQDVLYIHDALLIFGDAIDDELVPVWKALESTLSETQRRSVRAGVSELFSRENDIIREAVSIASRSDLNPSIMLRRCQEGFEDLLGDAF